MTVTLKLATSLDGKIATASGESRWITGPASRAAVHHLRAENDAVVVGIETALADDPDLTVRLEGYEGPQPSRVVLDSRQRLPETARLAVTARQIPTYLVTTQPPQARLTAAGIHLVQVAADADGRARLPDVVEALARRGLRRLFVEGGGQVAASFLKADLVDALEWFRAPIVIGAEGRSAVGDLALAALAGAPKFQRLDVRPLGDDLWERYERF
jgi:diaminohydroxyphosphoribosylaminopyrimidine deaminase/5-amino-6-(5-phosphoribosylamino)uracil reductase